MTRSMNRFVTRHLPSQSTDAGSVSHALRNKKPRLPTREEIAAATARWLAAGNRIERKPSSDVGERVARALYNSQMGVP